MFAPPRAALPTVVVAGSGTVGPGTTGRVWGVSQRVPLHAGVRVGARGKQGREKLVRCCLRPALALLGLGVVRDGSTVFRAKYRMRGAAAREIEEGLARVLAV